MPRDAVRLNWNGGRWVRGDESSEWASCSQSQGIILSTCSRSNSHAANVDLCLPRRNACRAISLCLENRAVSQQTLVILLYGGAQSLYSRPSGVAKPLYRFRSRIRESFTLQPVPHLVFPSAMQIQARGIDDRRGFSGGPAHSDP